MAKRKWIRHMVFVACGMAAGWAYARFIGCGSSCAIRSNPYPELGSVASANQVGASNNYWDRSDKRW